MIRRFNYTERKTLGSEHVTIKLRRSPTGPMSFDATLHLEETGLPGQAKVFLEAYYKSSYMRFDYGTIGSITPPADRLLTDVDRGNTVFFRLKVVDFSGAGGRLLAEADELVADESGSGSVGRYPLLPVRFCDLGAEIWRIDFNTGDRPVLDVNTFEGVEEVVKKNRLFFALVYPAAVREVLRQILIVEEVPEDAEGDGAGWQGKWLHFASQFNPDRIPTVEEDQEKQERMEWINKAVAEFSKANRVKEQFMAGLTEEDRL